MGIVLTFLVSIALVFAYPLLRQQYKKLRHHTAPHKHIQSYHAVSISPCSRACRNVKKLRGQLFLASEAVALPVAGCDHKHCTCSYRHHQDRRNGEDRRFPNNLMTELYQQQEHRLRQTDRRKTSFKLSFEEI